MPDYLDFLIRSSEKVVAHCGALLEKPINVQERARLNARVEAEREFTSRLRGAYGKLAV